MIRCINDPHRIRARKQTWCDWCGKVIRKGEEHLAGTYAGEGEIYTFRECDRCAPYVREMLDDDEYNDPVDGLTSFAFSAFMDEQHRDVLKEWEAMGKRDAEVGT